MTIWVEHTIRVVGSYRVWQSTSTILLTLCKWEDNAIHAIQKVATVGILLEKSGMWTVWRWLTLDHTHHGQVSLYRCISTPEEANNSADRAKDTRRLSSLLVVSSLPTPEKQSKPWRLIRLPFQQKWVRESAHSGMKLPSAPGNSWMLISNCKMFTE